MTALYLRTPLLVLLPFVRSSVAAPLILAALTAPALAGDFALIVTGTVNGVSSSPPPAPFRSVALGDPVELRVEVRGTPLIQGADHWNYPHDPLVGFARIGGTESPWAQIGSTPLEVTDGASGDSLEISLDLQQVVPGLEVPIRIEDTSGALLASPDLSTLVGTSITPSSTVSLSASVLRSAPPPVLLFDVTEVRIVTSSRSLVGSEFCGQANNSTGIGGRIGGRGSDIVLANDLLLVADRLPRNVPAFFFVGRSSTSIGGPGGIAGILCVGGPLGRYVAPGQLLNTGDIGRVSLQLDLGATPTPNALVQVAPGESWFFQAWHRDTVGSVSTANLTNGLEVLFR